MFFDDDLPVWGFIGKTENKPGADGKPQARQYLFTHFHFDIGYNGNKVRSGLAAISLLSVASNTSFRRSSSGNSDTSSSGGGLDAASGGRRVQLQCARQQEQLPALQQGSTQAAAGLVRPQPPATVQQLPAAARGLHPTPV
jgi:hypothetical protein